MNRLVLAPQARQDLLAIWDYIACEKQSPQAADSQLDRLHDAISLLASQPLLGELREDLRPELRAFSTDAYIIFYRARPSAVEIVSVIHGARDYKYLFRIGER